MRNILCVVFLLASVVTAQEKDMIYMFDGKKAVLLLSDAPSSYGYIKISRSEGGGQMTLLNDKNPLMSVDDYQAGINILGDQLQPLREYLDVDNNEEVLRAVSGNGSVSAMASLVFSNAAIVSGRWFTDSTAVSGKEYTYKVVYYNSLNEEKGSLTKKVKAIVAPVTAPTDLTAEYNRGIMKLSWKYPSTEEDKNSYAVRFYVYRKDSSGSFVKFIGSPIVRNEASQPVFSEPIYPDGPMPEYYVTAADPMGNESKPSASVKIKTVSADIPSSPTGLMATAAEEIIELVWNKPVEENIKGYNLYRKSGLREDSVKLNKALIDAVVSSFIDTTVKSGRMYFYYATAVNNSGKESRLSNVATAQYDDFVAPALPSGLKVTLDKKFVKVEWKKSESRDVKGYWVYRTENEKILPKIALAEGTSYIDSGFNGKGLEAGRTYYYTLTAMDYSENESEKLDFVSLKYPDTEPPMLPVPFYVTNDDGKTINLSVGNSGSADFAKLNVYKKSLASKVAKPVLLTTIKLLPSTFTDTTGKTNEKVVYMIQAIDTAGNESDMAVSDTVVVTNNLVPATVPYVVAVKTDAGVKVHWVTIADPELAGYNVYSSSVPNGEYSLVSTSPVKGNEFTDKNGTFDVYYKVRAVNASGVESEWSEATGVEKEGGSEQ